MKVSELLNAPERWTQGHGARDTEGRCVSSYSSLACKWCLIGALCKVYGERVDGFVGYYNPVSDIDATKKIAKKLGVKDGKVILGLIAWNDHPDRKFEDVRSLLLELDL